MHKQQCICRHGHQGQPIMTKEYTTTCSAHWQSSKFKHAASCILHCACSMLHAQGQFVGPGCCSRAQSKTSAIIMVKAFPAHATATGHCLRPGWRVLIHWIQHIHLQRMSTLHVAASYRYSASHLLPQHIVLQTRCIGASVHCSTTWCRPWQGQHRKPLSHTPASQRRPW